MRIRLVLTGLTLFAVVVRLPAQSPAGTAFTYQGQLKSNGLAANGNYDIRFGLWDSLTGGTQIAGPLIISSVPVTLGLFTAQVEFGNQFNGDARYVQVSVRPAGGSTFTILAPRQQLTPAPYAAGLALPIAATANDTSPALSLINTGGAAISVNGAADGIDSMSTGAGAKGIYAVSTGAGGTGIKGECDNGSTATGVWGRSSSGYGVVGEGTSGALGGIFSSDSGIGLYAVSETSHGIHGVSGAYSGLSPNYTAGVFGDSHDGQGVVGMSAMHAGVYGLNGAASGYSPPTSSGVRGESHDGYGVAGTSNMLPGVYGVSGSASGVLGIAHGPSGGSIFAGPGVWGDSDSGDGVNGYTSAPNATGVFAASLATTGTGIGVYGFAGSSSGYGGFFNGRMAASGTKSFQIDHPLDPENKYLNHYCAEGPDPLNVYSGNVTTDAAGEAWVALPGYFQAINKDFRYTLTIVDANDFALARVSHEIEDNRFAIKTSRANVKVSWEVKATRNDRFVRTYGAPVEQAKPADKRGTYLQPELYGKPRERGQFYRPGAELSTAPTTTGG